MPSENPSSSGTEEAHGLAKRRRLPFSIPAITFAHGRPESNQRAIPKPIPNYSKRSESTSLDSRYSPGG